MSRLSALVRTALRVNFGWSLLTSGQLLRHKRDWWLVPLILLGVVGLVPTMIYYIKLIKFLYNSLALVGQTAAILTMGVLLGQFLILVFGLYYIIAAFYFSRDLALLIPLPLTPTQVVLSKFTVILVNEYLTIVPLVLPILIVYGLLSRGGPVYWMGAALVYLLLPVIPLAIDGLLVFGMMRVVNLSRKKDALIILGSLVLIAAGLGFQFWSGQRATGSEPDPNAIVRLLSDPNGLVQRVGASFPPSIWATKALAHGLGASGLANTALFSIVSLVLFLGLLTASKKLFYEGLIGLSETSTARRILSREQIERGVSSGRRPVRAIFLRELRLMNRTPIFLLNGVLAVVLIPALFLIMAKAGSQPEGFGRLLGLVQSGNPTVAVLAAALFMAVCGGLNGTASSTYSREGAQFWISKVIPVSPTDQAKGKFLHSYVVVVLGLAAATAVLTFVFQMKASLLLAALVLAALAGVVMAAVGMMIDLARPLLTWINPQKAIKQNLNVLLAFFADLGMIFGLFLLTRILRRLGLAGAAQIAVLTFILLVMAGLSFSLLLKLAEKRLPRIE
jgi:ABC-2 type transport system permease protein